jgi:hypothetical protein
VFGTCLGDITFGRTGTTHPAFISGRLETRDEKQDMPAVSLYVIRRPEYSALLSLDEPAQLMAFIEFVAPTLRRLCRYDDGVWDTNQLPLNQK